MIRYFRNIFQESTSDELSVIDIDSYRNMCRGNQRPSDNQIKGFVQFVCKTQSWDKYLPAVQPGVPFHFYFDQFAGWKRIRKFTRGIKFEKYYDEDVEFHNSRITTIQYQKQFGWLSFACNEGSRRYTLELTGIHDPNHTSPFIYTSDGKRHQVPNEVLEVGTIKLTAPISDYFKMFFPWYELRTIYDVIEALTNGEWPIQSGKKDVLSKTVKYINLHENKFKEYKNLDVDIGAIKRQIRPLLKEIAELIVPEQKRLQQNMFITIKNMCKLVYN